MTADGEVYRHNWLCHTWREAGDGFSEEAETIHLAKEYGIETDEWTLVRDPRPANPGQRLAIERIDMGKSVYTDARGFSHSHVYVETDDGRVWRWNDQALVGTPDEGKSGVGEYMVHHMELLGSINPRHWTQVRGGAA